MKLIKSVFIATIVSALCCVTPVRAARLKDLADIEGVRSNQLIGFGLVVGLNGSGDKSGSAFTSQSLANMLERLGVRVDPKEMKLANVASVAVTADLPPFVRPGSRLDISLSSLGDAKTLQGGMLLMTPLRGPDGKVYAVAQGAVSVGGFSISSTEGDTAQKNHPTVGLIASGAVVERAIPFNLFAAGQVRVVLRDPDFATASRVERAINKHIASSKAVAIDSASVLVPLDTSLATSPVDLLAQLGEVDVEPDSPARVVINERTGTVIMGENVKVSTVALAHANLNITIRAENEVVQPEALAGGETARVQNTDVTVGEEEGQLSIVGSGASLKDLVQGLNRLGATPRDLVAILQALKRAGALHAELVVM